MAWYGPKSTMLYHSATTTHPLTLAINLNWFWFIHSAF